MLKKCVYIALAILSSSGVVNAYQISLEGKDDCKGTEIGSKTSFRCEMVINKTGETYGSSATCDDGNSYKGTGIYDNNTHILSSGFINPKKAKETGVAVTYIKDDGSMTTDWTYLNNTTIGHTACIKKSTKSE